MAEKQTKVIVSAETSKYAKSMKRLAASDKKITRDMQYRWAKVKSAMTGVAGKLVALAGVGGMILLGKRALETGDIIHKLNLRLGISTEALSELQHVSNLSGVSFQTTAKSYQKMSENISDASMGIGTAKDSIADLNMDLATLHAMSPERQFEAIADAMTGITNQSDKIRIAADIFGGRGVEMLQIMDKGADGIREMRDQAQRLGMTLSQDAANKIAAFNDSMVRLSGAVMGAARSIMAAMGPALTAMVDWFGDKIPKAIKWTIEGLDNLKKASAAISLGSFFGFAKKEPQHWETEPLPSPMGGDITPADAKRLAGLDAAYELTVEDKARYLELELTHNETLLQMRENHDGMMANFDLKRLSQIEQVENQIVSLKQRSADMQRSLHTALFTTLLQVAGVSGKKLFFMQKAWEVGSAIMSAFTASNLAMATIPPPVGEAVAAARLRIGLLNAKIIAAMAIGQAAVSGGGSVGGGTYISPTVTTPADAGLIPPTEERRGTLTINIQGDILGDEGTIDMLVEKINAAEDRDVFINQTNYATEVLT